MMFSVFQGRGVGNGKKKTEAAAAALEDRDKPYACDSKLLSSGVLYTIVHDDPYLF